jgi:hypothetical protein
MTRAPPGRRSICKTVPKSVFSRPSAKKCDESRLSSRVKSAKLVTMEMRKSLPSIPSIPKCNSDEATCCSVPTHQTVSPFSAECKNNLVDLLFQLFSCSNASRDELMFLGLAKRCGIKEATYWATKLRWRSVNLCWGFCLLRPQEQECKKHQRQYDRHANL